MFNSLALILNLIALTYNMNSRKDFFPLNFGMNLEDWEILLFKSGSMYVYIYKIIPFAYFYHESLKASD